MEGKNKKYPVDGGFLQSEHWEKFQKSLNRKVVKIGDENMKALLIFHKLPTIGGYFFVPRGPIIKTQKSKVKSQNHPGKLLRSYGAGSSKLKTFLINFLKIAKKDGVGWIRVEPQSFEDWEIIKGTLGNGYKVVKSKKDHEPAQTLMIDLEKTEDEIIAQMKPKTRYNIRLASKRGVEVFSARDDEHINKFIELTKITAKRDKLTPHPDEYYRKMIEEIPGNVLKVYFAKYQEEIISTIMVSFFGRVATYLHGASSNVNRNVMAPFALQWQAVKDAKRAGYSKYDLGGTRIVKESGNMNCESGEKKQAVKRSSSWAGITRFKQGFCPDCRPVEFPGCWDIIIDTKKYWLYGLLQGAKDKLKK